MKKLLFISTAVLGLTVAHGQTQVTFQKAIGGIQNDVFYSVQTTIDEGYFMVGSTLSFGSMGNNVYLTKLDSLGNILWTKIYGSTGDDVAGPAIQLSSGGYLLAGYTDSYIINGFYNISAQLIKTDSDGNIIWTKIYNETPTITSQASNWDSSIVETLDGGFCIGGTSTQDCAWWSLINISLIKTDSNGNFLWGKSYGGSDIDECYSIMQLNDGGFIVSGQTKSYGVGGEDIYLIRTDSNGDTLWSRTYGGTDWDYSGPIEKTFDGGFIIAGTTYSFGNGGEDIFLIKIDLNGDTVWTKAIGSSYSEIAASILQTTDSGFIITGSVYDGKYNVLLVKINSSGNVIWAKSFGGSNDDYGAYGICANDGGYFISGTTGSFGLNNSYDSYVIKTNINGNSGCNDSNLIFFEQPTSTIITSPPTQYISCYNWFSAVCSNNSGGIVSNICSNIGINEINYNNYFSIFPNPFSSQTVLQTDNLLHNATLTVDNCFGQTVKQIKNINGQTVVLSRDNLASGLYFVRLTEENKTIAVDKLVIVDR